MCSAHRLMMLYIGVKFHEDISNGIRVIERTRNHKVLTDGQTLKISDGIPRHFLWRSITKQNTTTTTTNHHQQQQTNKQTNDKNKTKQNLIIKSILFTLS